MLVKIFLHSRDEGILDLEDRGTLGPPEIDRAPLEPSIGIRFGQAPRVQGERDRRCAHDLDDFRDNLEPVAGHLGLFDRSSTSNHVLLMQARYPLLHLRSYDLLRCGYLHYSVDIA